jgi:hypothetical protein
VPRRGLSDRDANIARVTRRLLPVGLVVAAAAAGVQGHGRLGFYLLVAAVPACAAAALALFGDLLDVPAGTAGVVLRLELALTVVGLVLLLVAAAARSAVPAGEPVPAPSAVALGAALALLVTQSLVGLVAPQAESARTGAAQLRRVPAR